MSGNPKKAEQAPAVAAWIVTYSDMVTLLLTFFVMLLSMAKTQVEEHKFLAGQNSIRRALADFGLSGYLFNQNSGPEFEHPKPAYNIDEGDDEPEDRSIDAQKEMLRRIMLEIEAKMKISPSQIDGVSKTFLPLKIRFASKSSTLNESAKKELYLYWTQIQTSIAGQEPIFYILGLAADETNPSQQWSLSARRAQAVKEYLESLNQTQNKLPIFCWGAGSGGEWVGQSGLTAKETQIMIALIIEK